MNVYLTGLRRGFSEYRDACFGVQSNLVEDRAEGGAVVLRWEYRDRNLMIPPCSASEREQIIGKISRSKRHRHFGSMQSSQALAQSVFGSIEVCGRLPLLSAIKAEDGRPAFGSSLSQTKLEFEKDVDTLGEQSGRSTSVDVWFGGPYRVAVECKLAEANFGTCSRTRLETDDKQHCDGSYTLQGGRTKERCALTHAGVGYWNYSKAAFGWSPDIDHRRCPMNETYQLMRNVLAACVMKDGTLTATTTVTTTVTTTTTTTMTITTTNATTETIEPRQRARRRHCLRRSSAFRRLSIWSEPRKLRSRSFSVPRRDQMNSHKTAPLTPKG
jgi:hypothetical protein